MSIITQTFTYKIPNIFGSKDDSEGKTGTLTYEGPEWFFVYVDEKTGYIREDLGAIPSDLSEDDEILARSREENGTTAVLVNATDEPVIAYIIFDLVPSESEISEERIYLNPGDKEPLFTNNSPLSPREAYEVEKIRWSFSNRAFAKPLQYNDVKVERQNWLDQIEDAINQANEKIDSGELTAEELTEYQEYLERLQSWEETTADYPFHLVPLPRHPDDARRFESGDPDDDGDVEPQTEVFIDPQDSGEAYYTEEEMASVLSLHKAWTGSSEDFANHVSTEKGWSVEETLKRIDFLTSEPASFLEKLETTYLS